MSLRIMLFVGCIALLLGYLVPRLTPMTRSQEKSILPTGTSAVSYGDVASISLAKSRLNHLALIDSRERVDISRR